MVLNFGKPFLSIITPCLNRAAFVREAVESVLHQDFSDFEHIVVDGGSTDGTLEILRQYSHLKVISEPDKGLYDAINKGVKLAQGKIIGLLNTDDFYGKDVFGSVVEVFKRNADIRALVGGARVFLRENGVEKTLATYSPPSERNLLESITVGVPLFNAWFFRRSLFEEVGELNLRYTMAADREFLLRFFLFDGKFIFIDRLFYHYRHHQGSLTFSGDFSREYRLRTEYIAIVKDYIQRRAIPPHFRKALLKWHTQSTVVMASLALREFKFWDVLRYGIAGSRYDPWWFFLFFRIGIRGLARLMGLRG